LTEELTTGLPDVDISPHGVVANLFKRALIYIGKLGVLVPEKVILRFSLFNLYLS
jgi:hypothetical protein